MNTRRHRAIRVVAGTLGLLLSLLFSAAVSAF